MGDPTKFVDKEPVATGPFKVGTYNGRRLELVRRPDYWQADKIKVEKLVLEGNSDANQAALKLRRRRARLLQRRDPQPGEDIRRRRTPAQPLLVRAQRPHRAAPQPDQDAVQRRQVPRGHLAYGMNKERRRPKATYGIMEPASQSGLVLPAKADDAAGRPTPEQTVIPFDLAKANQLLDAAGYKKDADGKRTNPDGSPLSITLSVQSGWIDYEAMADEFVANFRELGLDIKANKIAAGGRRPAEEDRRLPDHDQLHGTPAATTPTGWVRRSPAANVPDADRQFKGTSSRFSDPAVDAASTRSDGTTDEAAVRRSGRGCWSKAMMTQFPVTARSCTRPPAASTAPTRRSAGRARRTRTATHRTTQLTLDDPADGA